jgi:hypothetical protein
MPKRLRAGLCIAIALSVVYGWVLGFLPGRVPWVHLSFPSTVVLLPEGALVPVPSVAADGTTWGVGMCQRPTDAPDGLCLYVERWMSHVMAVRGDRVTIGGKPYTFVDVRQRGVYLRPIR